MYHFRAVCLVRTYVGSSRLIQAQLDNLQASVVGGSIEYLMGLTYVYSVLCMWWWLKGPTTRSWPPNGKKNFLPPFLVWMMVIDFLHKSTKSICYEAF